MIIIKKILNIFVCIIMCFLLCSCNSAPKNIVSDNNENYKSSDIDENGNLIGRESLSDLKNDEDTETFNESSLPPLKVSFLDVGNADSSLIQFPDGKNMIIDCGNYADGEDISSYLNNLGIEKIDFLIGTHPHEDHIGGMKNIIDSFDIGNIYLPKIPNKYTPTTKVYEELLDSMLKKDLTITSPKKGQIIYNENNLKIEFLNDPNDIDSDDLNRYSLVIKVTYNNNSFIFTGDADKENEDIILNNYSSQELECDVLKVGHHGSYTASSDEWLSALSPIYAFIPCGIGNQYEHPHDEVLKRLDQHSVTYYRADINGTIIIESDGTKLSVKTKCTGDIPLGDKNWDKTMIKVE